MRDKDRIRTHQYREKGESKEEHHVADVLVGD